MKSENKGSYNILTSNVRIAKNSIYMSIRMIVVLGVTLYSTRIILNALGVEEYGIFNVVAGFVGLFSFLSTSMSNSIQRFFNFEYAKNGLAGAKRVFNTSLLIQVILAIVLLCILEALGPWYIKNKMVLPPSQVNTAVNLFHCSVISFLCVVLQSPFLAAVMAHERMGFYSVISVLDASLKLLIAFILPYLGGEPLIVYGLLLVLTSLVVLFSYFIYARIKFEEIRFAYHWNSGLLKAMLSFSGWNLFGTFSGIMKDQGVNLIMNLFFGPIVNAAKGVATQVNNGIQSFVSNIIVPVRPQLVQSYSLGNIDRVMRLTYSVSKLSTFMLYVISVPLLYELDYILRIWLGTNIPEYSSSFIRIVIFMSFINNLNGSISGVVHASGRMKKYQLWGAIVNLLAIPLVYISLRLGGTPELAMSLVACVTLANQIVCMLVLKTIVSYSIMDYIRRVISPFIKVICITCWVPLLLVNFMDPTFLRFCLVVIISVVTILPAVYFVGLSADEKMYVKKILKKY